MEDRERDGVKRYLRLGEDATSDVRDELEAHVELLVADLVAEGWDVVAAQLEARRRFADREELGRVLSLQRRGYQRETRMKQWFSELAQDVRMTLRQYRRAPLVTLLTSAVFALGLGAAVAVFAVLDVTLLRPLPFQGPDRLVYVTDRQGEEDGFPASLPELRDWQEHADFLEHVTGWNSAGLRLRTESEPLFVYAANVTGDFPSALGIAPLIGNWLDANGAQEQVVLDETFWSTHYDRDPSVIGRTLTLNDRSYLITGVLPAAARLALRRSDIALYRPFVEQEWMQRGTHFVNVLARIRADVSGEEAAARLQALSLALQSDGRTTHGVGMVGMRQLLVGDSRSGIILLAGAVVFLLLIVTANLSNLFLARSLDRQKEWTIRLTLGAGRFRLLRQLMVESWLMAAAGFGGAVVIAHLAIVWLAPLAGSGVLAETTRVDLRVLLFGALLTVLIASLVAAFGHLRGDRANVAGALSAMSRATGSRAHWRSRRTLLGFEMAISVVLVIGAMLMVRSVSLLLDVDPGYDPRNAAVFTISAPATAADEESRAEFFRTLLERTSALPGVIAAGAANEVPLTGGDVSGGFAIPGHDFPDDAQPHAKKRVVTPGYFEAMRIPLLSGRAFDTGDRLGALDVAIVSESVARRYWPGGNAVGQRIRYSWGPGDEQVIVGIAGDIHHDALDSERAGIIYRPHAQFVHPSMYVTVRTAAAPLAILPALRGLARELAPTEPLRDVRTLEDIRLESIGSRRVLRALLAAYSAVALLLTALGVYAVAAQAIAQRTAELGIRMALGARTSQIVRHVVAAELPPLLIGLLAGLAAAAAATRYMTTLLYGVSPGDPVAFAAAVVTLALVGLLALALPLRRAARSDPLAALRS